MPFEHCVFSYKEKNILFLFTAKGFIGSLPVASVEKAFGLKPGDVKLIDDPACTKLIEQNAWTKYEKTLGIMVRFEAIRDSSFNTGYGKLLVALSKPIFDFISGRMYTEHIVYGPFRLFNLQADYMVVGYVNENVRLVQRIMPWQSKDTKVCFMSKSLSR